MFDLTKISKEELLKSSVDLFETTNEQERKILIEVLNYLKMLVIHLSEDEWRDFQIQEMQSDEWQELQWFQQTPVHELYPDNKETSLGNISQIIKTSF